MYKEYIKCVGRNDKRLPYNEFNRLFYLECSKLGTVVWTMVLPLYAGGLVIPKLD